MGENNRLFPIGVLSKLTGVHIRCLRYYEKLGILQPAHIDENTGYRYYTYRQMRIVEAIQYCVELDIPLKKFTEFLSQENGQIDYAGLTEYGKKVTEEKMQSILKRQQFQEDVTESMAHAERCAKEGNTVAVFPERLFYCLPYEGAQSGSKFQSTMVKLIDELESNGFHASYDNGILTRKQNGQTESFCFVAIKDMDADVSAYPQIIRVPAGEYLCTVTDTSGAADTFARELAENNEVYIIETELFSGKYSYEKPTYELRCSTGNEPK